MFRVTTGLSLSVVLLLPGCIVPEVPPFPTIEDACEQAHAREDTWGTTPDQGPLVLRSLGRVEHDAGVTLFLVAAQANGTIFAQLHEPLSTGLVPRNTRTEAGCTLPDRFFWKASSEWLPATGRLTVLDGGTGTGETLSLEFTQLQASRDGGNEPLDDFSATFTVR